ncbi:MAG: response regulator [Proteobacteria bacterium]|nr:response regulator [Pseudomonadota bacterium]
MTADEIKTSSARAFSQPSAEALERMGLRLESTIRMLSAVARLSEVPVLLDNLSGALDEILDVLVLLLDDLRACSLLLLGPDMDFLRLMAAYGPADLVGDAHGPYNKGLTFKLGEGMAGRACQENRPIFWNENAPENSPAAQDPSLPPALAAMPLSYGDRCFGVLNISFHSPGALGSVVRRDLILLSRVVSNVIRTFMFKEELDRKADSLEKKVAECEIEIDERRKAQERLFRSEASLAEAQRIAGLGNWEWLVASDRLACSDGMFRLLGLNPQPSGVPYSTFIEAVAPEDRDRVEASLRESLKMSGQGQTECRFLRPEGSKVDVRFMMEPLLDHHRHVIGVMGTAQNITAEKQAEQEIQERVNELTALNKLGRRVGSNLSVEHVVQSALDQIMTSVSPDMAFIFLKEGEKLRPKGRRINTEVRIAELAEHQVGQCLCGLAAGRNQAHYSKNIHQDARCTWDECNINGIHSLAALPMASGIEVIGVVGLASLQERDFSEKTDFLATLVNTVSIGLQNALLHERVIQHGQTLEIAVTQRTAELRKSNLDLQREIQERKKTQEELILAKAAAEEASRAKSVFLANMSHDIRTPLNGIIGMAELVMGADLKPEKREYMGMLKISANSLLSLLNDILDFSKIEAGKMQLERITFNFRDSLDETMNTMGISARNKGLEISCSVQPDVPEFLEGDPGRLRQILFNLLSNAVKFTERGEIVTEVRLESEPQDPVVLHVSVRDTGIGIPPEKQNFIFSPFNQAETSMSRRYGGTGLGLSISSQLAELMGGRLWVESQVGHGSVFHFKAVFGRPAPGPLHPEDVRRPDLRGLFALVLADNPANRASLEATLIEKGMTAGSAETRDKAFEDLKQRPYDLLVIDQDKPGPEGFDFAERVRKDLDAASPRILLITSSGQRGDASRCREAGIDGYLTKPVGEPDLIETVQALMSPLYETASNGPLTRHVLRERHRCLRILVVEDNEINQRLVRGLLEKRGYPVEIVGNGLEAVQRVAKGGFDLVLMDVQMPIMDGMEAARRIRDRERLEGGHVPILAMTAQAMKGDQERCLEAGMDAYISKPLDTLKLFRLIEQWTPRGPRPPRVEVSRAETEAPAPTLDLDELIERLQGDRDLLSELAGLFFTRVPDVMRELDQAVLEQNSNEMKTAAHGLKGMAGNLSAKALSRAAQRLEAMGRDGNLSGATEAMAALRLEIGRLREKLSEAGLTTRK